MSWVKLDDDFLFNPKVMTAGLHARALYVAGLCYAAKGLTDGRIPGQMVRKLGVVADVADPERAAERLAEVGLWEVADGGYQIHDYLDYNPSADEMLALREARAEAGRLGGIQRASNRLASAEVDAKQDAKQDAGNLLSRTPTPSRTQDPSPNGSGSRPGDGLGTRTRARRNGAQNGVDPDEWLARRKAAAKARQAVPDGQ